MGKITPLSINLVESVFHHSFTTYEAFLAALVSLCVPTYSHPRS